MASTAMDSMFASIDRMMQRIEETLARMDSAPATVTAETSTATSSSASSSPAATTTVTATTTPGVTFTAPAPLASNSSPTSPTTPPTAPTSIDTTKLDSTTKTEPLHALPARCSMPGRSHGERALAPVTAVSASPLTLATASDASAAAPATSPTRCSPTCLSHENNMLKSYSVECSKPPPTSTHAEVVFDEMHQRYIITRTSAYYVGSVLLCLATQVQDGQKVWEPMVVLSPVFLEPWPANVVDMRHGQSILNSEQLCIPPKPPWSLLGLEDDTPKSNISTQVTLMPWTHLLVLITDVQLRPIPWPSFISRTKVVCCSVSQSSVKPLFGDIIQVVMQSAEGQLWPALWLSFNFHAIWWAHYSVCEIMS